MPVNPKEPDTGLYLIKRGIDCRDLVILSAAAIGIFAAVSAVVIPAIGTGLEAQGMNQAANLVRNLGVCFSCNITLAEAYFLYRALEKIHVIRKL